MKEKQLPPIHNTRSPQQWEIISKHIDFKDKTVLDLGCGYGDILFRCWGAGARHTLGIDRDDNICQLIKDNLGADNHDWMWLDIDELYRYQFSTVFDIIICFSVLPYLKQPFTILEWIKEHSQIALIEIQYALDGPGFDSIQDDGDMAMWLAVAGWPDALPIGKTLVKDRQKYRTIWECK